MFNTITDYNSNDIIDMGCVVKAEKALEAANVPCSKRICDYNEYDCLVTCNTGVTPQMLGVKTGALKEPKMYNETKAYFESRVYAVSSDKRKEAGQFFHTAEDARPNSVQELIDRITAGKFTLPKDPTKSTCYPWEKITWRDPKVIPDDEGYKAFTDKLDVAVTQAHDEITAAGTDGDKMLAALQKVQAFPVA